VTLTGSSSRDVTPAAPVEFAGPIGDGGAGIGLRIGSGSAVVMSGANTYSGATTLFPSSSVTFAARQDIGDVTINSQATALFQTSQHFKTLDVGVAYAIWSGVGTAVVATLGVLLFSESMSVMKAAWIGVIIVGVIGLQATSGSAH